MHDLKKLARDLGYFSVGAAAVIVEAGSKTVRTLVRKGEKTLQDNQETVNDIKRKAKEAGDWLREAVERASAPQDEPAEDDILFPDAIYHTDEPVPEEEPAVEIPVAEEPVVETPAVEEAIVETPVVKEPAPQPEAEDFCSPAAEEKPEETING